MSGEREVSENEIPADNDWAQEDNPTQHNVLGLVAEIQRLHNTISLNGDIDNREELHEAHQERTRFYQWTRNGSRERSRTPGPVAQNGRVASNCSLNRVSFLFGVSIILIICVGTPLIHTLFEHILGLRCFVPNNYLIWEATRPKSDCTFCMGYDGPIILSNLTREEFAVSTTTE